MWANATEGTVTFQQSMALLNAMVAAVTTGMDTTTGNLRNLANTLNRVSATIDASGNRSAPATNFTDL